MSYLINNGLVSRIRVVDKTPPLLAWFNNQHMAAFNDNAVEFCSANLINQGQCQMCSVHSKCNKAVAFIIVKHCKPIGFKSNERIQQSHGMIVMTKYKSITHTHPTFGLKLRLTHFTFRSNWFILMIIEYYIMRLKVVIGC